MWFSLRYGFLYHLYHNLFHLLFRKFMKILSCSLMELVVVMLFKECQEIVGLQLHVHHLLRKKSCGTRQLNIKVYLKLLSYNLVLIFSNDFVSAQHNDSFKKKTILLLLLVLFLCGILVFALCSEPKEFRNKIGQSGCLNLCHTYPCNRIFFKKCQKWRNYKTQIFLKVMLQSVALSCIKNTKIQQKKLKQRVPITVVGFNIGEHVKI